MFIDSYPNETAEETMTASLESFFEPNPLNLGFHPVNPMSDAFPTVTLAVVKRNLISNPILRQINTISLGLLNNQNLQIDPN